MKDEVGIGKTLTNHTVNPGEKVFESINRLITKENLVVMDDEQGNLVITEPGSAGQAADALELGVNILAGSSAFDFSKRYSHYIAVGQHAGIDTDFGRSAAEDKGTLKTVESTLSQIRRRRARGTSGLWPSSP